MIIINSYGKIEKTCISNKLKLYISNLPNDKNNDWETDICGSLFRANEIDKIRLAECDDEIKVDRSDKLIKLYNKINNDNKTVISSEDIRNIANKLIYIYFDYEYEDLPFGDWTTNNFDSRFCEKDYVQYIVQFINFMSFSCNKGLPSKQFFYIYNSDNDFEEIDLMHSLHLTSIDDDIVYLKKWGELLDNFFVNDDDYFIFDYLCKNIAEPSEDVYYFEKIFSIVTMLLKEDENGKNTDKVNENIAYFLDNRDSKTNVEKAKLLRQIRNKIAHADVKSLNNKLEKYGINYMDGHYNYDYSEYSRQNWIIGYISIEITNVLKSILFLYLTDRNRINQMTNK